MAEASHVVDEGDVVSRVPHCGAGRGMPVQWRASGTGDTIHFTFINPEDDLHSFVMRDLVVQLPPQTSTKATYVARHAGIFGFVCSVATHLPMMTGQLVVQAPSG